VGENEAKCELHSCDFILFCLKCQEKICTTCLDTNHLLHPVVPLNSVNKLDFKKSLQKEIEKSLEDIRNRERRVHKKIGADLRQHKVALRNYIVTIRETMRKDFDDFFNQLLASVREDWNLFELQEVLSGETAKFSKEILEKLACITQQDEFEQIYLHNDIKKFYESLSTAQQKVQVYKQDWNDFERGVDDMVEGLKGYSDFDVVDGASMKNFLAESIVMNYSNIEIHKLLYQQMATSKRGQPSKGRAREQRVSQNESVQNICFNRNSQLAMAKNFEHTGIRVVNREKQHLELQQTTNKIHFFKFD
jgi:hypothetical protein